MIIIITMVTVGVILLYLFMISPAQLPPNSDTRLWQYHYAHRGLHNKDQSIPENSVLAFEKAVEAGYGMELDINLSADGQVVVFHDDNLLRVCGVDKLITDCSLTELLGYRLEQTGEGILLLTDVLKRVNGQTPLIVELKNTKNWQLLCEKAAAILDHYPGSYCVESFHPGIVRWFYKNRPLVIRGQLSANHRSFEELPVWQSLMIASILTNVAARPHFVAYDHKDAHHRLSLRLFRQLGGKLAGWAIRDMDDPLRCMRFFDVIIFEFFRPAV